MLQGFTYIYSQPIIQRILSKALTTVCSLVRYKTKSTRQEAKRAMAMRPTTPTISAQPSPHPVYENVQPKSEMKENKEAYLLHIYLPGFIKDRIRITFVGSSRMVKVVGERPTDGGNRWSRFDQTYPIPENCEVERLQGKFEQGILIVTMPKKFISQVSPKAEVKTTQEKGPSPSKKVVAEPKSKVVKEAIPQKSTTNRVEKPIGDKKNPSLPSTVKGPIDLKEQNGTQKDTPPAQKPKEISQKLADDKGFRALIPFEPFREPRPQNAPKETVQKTTIIAAIPKEQIGKPQKGQEEIEPKPTLTMDPKKQIDEKRQEENRQKTILATIKKQLSEKVDKEIVTKKEVKEEDGNPFESRKPEKDMDHQVIFKGKEIRTRKESPKTVEPSIPNAQEKETSNRRTTPSEEAKSKDDVIDKIGKGIRELVASASQVVSSIGEGKLNDQDKHLVANMGAAILVIVALGAYVSYKFASSGKA